MKLSIDRQEFEKALFIGQNVAQPKGAMQILGYLLLEAGDNTLTIKATDLELAIEIQCAAEVEETGKIILPAKTMYDTVRKGINSTVNISVGSEFSCSLDTGTNYNLVGLDPEEYPELPVADTTNLLTVNAGAFVDALKKTLYATSDNEARLSLNGVFIKPEDDGLRFVSTDGHRLAMTNLKECEGSLGSADQGVILARKSLQELIKSLPDKKQDIQIGMYERFVIFRWKGVSCTVRLVDADFPNYQQVIPDNLPQSVVFNRMALLESIDRVGAVANDRFSGLKFSFNDGEVELSCDNFEHGKSRDRLAVEFSGEEARIGFNIRYIQSALQAMDSEDITMFFRDQLSATLLKEPDESTVAVIMPLRI